jgi:parvulin-like peptidyl-prolyl isomerase
MLKTNILLCVLFLLPEVGNGQCISGNCSNGKGTYIWSNGNKYIGDWKGGRKDGYGTFILNRSEYEIEASHILVSVKPEALPVDTLRAWRRISQLRARVAAGEDFTEVARSKGGSDDPSAVDNGGDLGWFQKGNMVESFENIAYITPVGEISNIVRTRFGYHIIKVNDKRYISGEIKVAHIMVRVPDVNNKPMLQSSKATIEALAEFIKSGETFESLALKYSDDATTASKGGVLPWFGIGKMVVEFENASFALGNDGDISEPFLSSYGWHIVKRISYRNKYADMYVGEWKDNTFNGYGTYMTSNGDQYEGEWKENKMSGFGTLTINGVEQRGEWKDGMLIESTIEDVILGNTNIISQKAVTSNGLYSKKIHFNSHVRNKNIERIFVHVNKGKDCLNNIRDGQEIALLTESLLLGTYDILERRHLNKILEEQKLSASGLLNEETTIELGLNEGAQAILFIEISCLNGEEAINLKLVGCQSSELFWSCTGIGLSPLETILKIKDELAQ